MKFIFQTLLIAAGIVFVLTYTLPEYKKVSDLRSQVVKYDEALNNAKELQQKRDEILASYNSISEESKERLTRILPDIDEDIVTSGSVALILEVDKIAGSHGIQISDVSFASESLSTSNTNEEANSVPVGDYAKSTLSFKMQSSYNNFLNFVKDLENNLRIVDIKKVSFTIPVPTRERPLVNTNLFEYSFELQSYWLRN